MSNSKDNFYRTDANLDEAMQRELDEALGGMSLEDILEAERAPRQPVKDPSAPPAGKGVRTGRIISIQGDDIFIDMGGKSQGVLSASQFEDEPLPAEGDTIEVTIEGYKGDEGLLLLSRQGAVMAAAWETLEEGQILEGRVTGHNKGGLELDINGIRAFLPVSQLELFRVEDLTPYVNQRLRCQVLEIDHSAQNVVVSRRPLLEVEAAEAREKTFETLTEGKVLRGTVKTVMPYGAFVDIGGVDGLLHVSDMSHKRVDDPNKVVKVGQSIEVKVLKIDREARKISLGLKQTLADPWIGVEQKWPVGDLVSGRVTRLADFGAFVELEEGVEGLLPIGELTFEKRVKHPSEVVNSGDVVRVRVLSVDVERKRISLSLKRAGDDPWMGAASRWPANTIVDGIVKRLTDFGAFVEVIPGVEGLVHISEISHDRIRTVADALQEGQHVQAKVLSVEEDRRRISLSIKQASSSFSSPEASAPAASAEPEAPRPQPKRKKPLRGGLE